MIRLAITVRGVVQGVGFRPFVHAAATARGLSGWVRNRTDGVRIEVEGPAPRVSDFQRALEREAPPAARLEHMGVEALPLQRELGFRILESDPSAPPRPSIPADLATCPDCLEEVVSTSARRFQYPFTNCTRCGPRWTIIEALPYDRARTSMKAFAMCSVCEAEYRDTRDRRFHAQPVACPACGPSLRLLGPEGDCLREGEAALREAVKEVLAGGILALQGLGGFQLLVDATVPASVELLRQRKRRLEKPFAVMFPSLDQVRTVCELASEEAAVLTSPAAPIVLLRKRLSGGAKPWVADAVAPGNPWLGALLPSTPLHRMLLDLAERPLVCTSGNLTDEPLCTAPGEALDRLRGVASLFLVHDRPILRPVDDSVVRMGPNGPLVLRRARGYAPLPLSLRAAPPYLLALGGHLKGTVALTVGEQAVVSQHLGDLGSIEGARLLERTVEDLLRLFEVHPEAVACDLHPDYASTRLGERLCERWGVPLIQVQHHHAHIAAVMAEHGLSGPVLGLAWDGAGLGTDGTLWGGEALIVEGARFRRVAHLRPFRLAGGEQAQREPRRAALGLLHAMEGPGATVHLRDAFTAHEADVLLAMLGRGLQSPFTTSMGRLFDAVAALSGVQLRTSFEGQAAMALEFAAGEDAAVEPYPLPLRNGEPAAADWEPLIRALLGDRTQGAPASLMARRFHASLVSLAEAIASRAGLPHVVLAGGCFQNLRLLRDIQARLRSRGFEVWTPQQYPPNDGSLSLGQLAVAAYRYEEARDVSRHPR
ncbi:carbamoyltransferase HypF [Hyalangium minutum]|uniref:Carbamoyltransferase n=1 Tax=Hyalangium minutum TaxID=394096 RepID=A0A085WHA3_9BACT|nr:carbamoyltransferase HypF [Hyalangium minutum]KFE67066.1 [NiFe] hydrogenase metallocenter assembly protein HypF [Hyalangium minutum]